MQLRAGLADDRRLRWGVYPALVRVIPLLVRASPHHPSLRRVPASEFKAVDGSSLSVDTDPGWARSAGQGPLPGLAFPCDQHGICRLQDVGVNERADVWDVLPLVHDTDTETPLREGTIP
ncbi:MAG TPA: hypothetical protein PLI31_06215 [Methanoregulaceae archaeon]|nr:hypothetical protein [Methanoregulaceae archaeon]